MVIQMSVPHISGESLAYLPLPGSGGASWVWIDHGYDGDTLVELSGVALP